MHEPPSTADLAYSEASDNARQLRIVAKRVDLCRRMLTEPMTRQEFERLWVEADPPPPKYEPPTAADWDRMMPSWMRDRAKLTRLSD